MSNREVKTIKSAAFNPPVKRARMDGMTTNLESQVSILVVDDDKVVVDLLIRQLRAEGYRIFSASDGEQAVQLMSQNTIDLVITDIKMPKLNGLDLLRLIKERHPETGVIIMTAYGDTHTVKEALLLGADEYLNKPFKAVEVSMIVERTNWRRLASPESNDEIKIEGTC